ncbi:glycosyltransferase family 4 protein [Thermothelomyces thermophilus ATCC 42464]|uniref:Alpha-1,3/1,6-mannosyltransferase ALG2 n=1 Tax=Thermothelomyces thermophilus (strain ATCC 42464 / BCRC 31852 / DSM 1799) TaxID=573729 RepID=G2QP62_THET4|nr:glycosyltransferase family 4 protein [Thermothelomyces thermophilus ATCC 42464]AEO61375.1 glycosyltransferase family 4 protein [Thermothelomyces thermophilus ATCC 42464]
MAGDKRRSKTIVFLHPDLGIGGAERLVIDAAVGLQKRGHKVVIFTSHCDPAHCFDEARDGTLDVRVRGNTLVPPTILGRFAILCAILRQLHLILQVAVLTRELAALAPDAFFVDQLSAGLPLLKLASPGPGRAPVFFYCHFPDLLLARGRARLWKRLYRLPFDALERWSMGFADAIAVNSDFTRRVVARTWPGLARTRQLHIVYPCIDTTAVGGARGRGKEEEEAEEKEGKKGKKGREKEQEQVVEVEPLPWKQDGVVLSINRFERKKDVALAIRAFALLPAERRRGAKLVVAGGYDSRVAENVSYHAELAALADRLGLRHATAKTLVSALHVAPAVDVLFLLSVPGLLKEMLLRSARLLVYTPSNEHFGIVPLEAMLRGVPVLAADSGGPRETVVDGVTGWLRDPERPEEWSAVMDRVLNDMPEQELQRMGRAGVERVKSKFAEAQMAERLEDIFDGMEKTSQGPSGASLFMMTAMAGLVAAVGLGSSAFLAGRIGGISFA